MSGAPRPEIAITVNSPGEVSTWLAPVIRELRKLDGAIRVSVFILPCTYAAGTEADVVRSLPGVDAVIPPKASLMYALFGRVPRGWRPFNRGAVLFLGGEYLLGARLIRRLGAEGLAYSAGYINGVSAFGRVFAPRPSAKAELVRRGVPEERVQVVGDLMVDAARRGSPDLDRSAARRALNAAEGDTLVALFPGSRPFEFRYALNFFARSAALMQARLRDSGGAGPLRFAVPVAPFIGEEVVRDALRAVLEDPEARAELDAAALAADAGSGVEGRFLFGERAVAIRFFKGRAREIIAAADLALAVPGSNNAEMAAWGLPMVVCLPLDRPEEIPIEGVLGLVDRIPIVGRKLKARAVLAAAERVPFVSLPNRIAGEPVVPELRSRTLAPEDVAAQAVSLLQDPARRSAMRRKLIDVMGTPGAARLVAEGVLAAARGAGAR